MNLEYKLSERDYLTFQLYDHSRNKELAKKNKKAYLRSSLIIIALIVLGWIQNLNELVIFMSVLLIFLLLDMLYRLKKKYHKSYSQNATKLYSGRIDMKVDLELNEEYIYSKTRFGESKHFLNTVNTVSVLPNCILVKLITLEYIIIKPNNVKETQEVIDFFNKHNKTVILDLNWKW